MRRIAVLSAAALIGAGTLASTAAEARGGGAIAAGIIGGLAAGAVIGAAAQAHPAYSYSYGSPYDGYGPTPVVVRPRPVYRAYEDVESAYATRRVVTYERVPVGYGHRRWHDDPDCDDDDGYGRRYRGW
ncbi:hypothetical protein [Methylobacterium pseudosasicola]|uniref:PXPV repeat-containing protein n=1 Tax=Methylobacterium pseudosasicola TaxID=582667 RepID=A0A1I4KN39_9HYPH|nr:hypothetical protein [Methylobacterium pseudosasicola]SFL80182.1 hypothetical protein SAMN05192568_101136 [Methylobacterium pseudosasicola]